MKNYKLVIAAFLIVALAGCGGGSSSSLEPTSATFYAGTYRNLDMCNASGTDPIDATLLDGNANVYRVCGTQLLVGQVTGTLNVGGAAGPGSAKITIFETGAIIPSYTFPLANGEVLTVPESFGKPSVSTVDTAGTLMTSANKIVNWFQLADAQKNVVFNAMYAHSVGSKTNSYSTLAGNYTSYLQDKNVLDSTTSLSISPSGVISGVTKLGSMTGQITNFDAVSGVHNVSVTFSPTSGAPTTLTGVIGPYKAALASEYGYLLLTVSGGATAYIKVFAHQ